MEFKIGESVMISNQYFIDKKIVDLPLYGTVVDKNDFTNELRIEDVDGNRYIINAWLCEKDNIKQMKDKDKDTKQEKEIKRLIRFIKEEVDNDNARRRIKARDAIDDYLFVCETDLKRVNNELNLRRAIYKFDELAHKQIEREMDDLDQDDIDLRESIIEGKVFEVFGELDEFGIFKEYEDERKKEKELNENNVQVVKQEPLSPMKAMLDFLDMVDKSIVHDKDDKLEDDEDDDRDFDGPDSDATNFGPFGLSPFSIQTTKKSKLPDCLIDMTDLAKRGRYNDIIGREDEIDTVAETLARKEIRNPLLIGKPGAGKTAVVEELVKRSYEGKIDHLKNKHFYELRMNDLVAGTMYRGQLEEKLQDVMKVLEDDPNVVLFIDEIHMIVQAGSTVENKNDVSAMQNEIKNVAVEGAINTNSKL